MSPHTQDPSHPLNRLWELFHMTQEEWENDLDAFGKQLTIIGYKKQADGSWTIAYSHDTSDKVAKPDPLPLTVLLPLKP